jgi:predicted nucleic acid-binding protein
VSTALLDSNVLIAIVAEVHEHHGASLEVLLSERHRIFAVAAHSYAEAFTTLTRRGEHAPFGFPPNEAWAALESVRAVTDLVGLTPAQIFQATRNYADSGGVGARLYDKLIGEAAVVHDIPILMTWNVSHMRGLFPNLTVVTPKEFLKSRA